MQWLVLIWYALKEMCYRFGGWLHDNLRTIANVLGVICPYVTAYAVLRGYQARGYIGVGGEWFIPFAFWIAMYVLRYVANKTGKGITIPVPSKRFTEVSEDGEITVHTSRIQELLVYLSDLEDWLDRKGLIK